MYRILFPLTLAAVLLLAIPAQATSMVICQVGGPGTTAQAQNAVDRFLRHVEKTSGLAASSMKGQYHTRLSDCLAYVKQEKPLMGVFDLPTFLAQQKALKLKAVGVMGSATGKRYHLLVKEGSFKDLAALQGKKLMSNLLSDPRFVSKVIFAGKIDAAKHFKLKTTSRPLKGIRKVARGKADATLVDELAYKHLGELGLSAKLVSIYSSAGLPGLTMVSLGSTSQDPTVKKVVGVLSRLCSGEGKKLCKTFRIAAFNRAKAGQFKRLIRQY